MAANKNQTKAKTNYPDKRRPDCNSTGTRDTAHKILLPGQTALQQHFPVDRQISQ